MALLRKPDTAAPLAITRDEHIAGYFQARALVGQEDVGARPYWQPGAEKL